MYSGHKHALKKKNIHLIKKKETNNAICYSYHKKFQKQKKCSYFNNFFGCGWLTNLSLHFRLR